MGRKGATCRSSKILGCFQISENLEAGAGVGDPKPDKDHPPADFPALEALLSLL
jgi:hypothetical protein